MSFPPEVKTKALIACRRSCCLCHKFVGLKIELHHIREKADGGEDTFENSIPLCFNCHADMRSYDHKHPKGTKYTPSELIQHRDRWYSAVASGIASSLDSHDPGHTQKQQNDLSTIQLDIGEDGRFFETMRAGGLYTHKRILKLKVSNPDTNEPMTNCKVQILAIKPEEYPGPWVLIENFSLAAGDHKFVPLVSYTEPDNIKISPYGDTFMEILVDKNRPLPSARTEHILTLRATAFGSPYFELNCKIWVDETGRLRIERQ